MRRKMIIPPSSSPGGALACLWLFSLRPCYALPRTVFVCCPGWCWGSEPHSPAPSLASLLWRKEYQSNTVFRTKWQRYWFDFQFNFLFSRVELLDHLLLLYLVTGFIFMLCCCIVHIQQFYANFELSVALYKLIIKLSNVHTTKNRLFILDDRPVRVEVCMRVPPCTTCLYLTHFYCCELNVCISMHYFFFKS